LTRLVNKTDRKKGGRMGRETGTKKMRGGGTVQTKKSYHGCEKKPTRFKWRRL